MSSRNGGKQMVAGCVSGCVALLLLLCHPTASAQESSSDLSLTGTVIDSGSGISLEGVRVSVSGQGQPVYTNSLGQFRVQNLRSGSNTVVARYLGFPDVQMEVTVAESEATNIVIKMGTGSDRGEITALDEIIVVGSSSATRKALNVERASDAFTSVVSSDVIGDFPDRNLAEVLQRAPGVTLRTQSGEGSYAIVRGVPPFLSTTSVNGRRLQSVQVEGRENRLGYFGAAAVERVEVQKVFLPQMQGDFIGGNINIVSKSPLSVRPSVDFTAEYGSAELRDADYVQVEATASGKFYDDVLGILVSAGYADRPQRTESVGTSLASSYFDSSLIGGTGDLLPLDLYVEETEIDSERKSLAIDIDYRPTPTTGLRLIASMTALDESRLTNNALVIFNPLAADITSTTEAGTYVTASNSVRFASAEYRKIMNTTALIIADKQFERMGVELRLGYGRADIDANAYELAFSQTLNNPISYSFADPSFPTLAFSGADVANERDAALYVDGMLRNNGRVQDGIEEQYDIEFNFSIPTELTGNRFGFDFGLRYSDLEKLTDVDQIDYPNDSVGSLLFGAGYAPIVAATSNAAMAGNDILGSGRIVDRRYIFGPFIDLAAGETFAQQNLPEVAPLSDFNSALRDFTADESITAAYLMATYQGDKTKIIAGLRAEKTRRSFTAVDAVLALPNTTITPIETSNSDTQLLPTIVVRHDLNNQAVLRFAVSQTYAQPNFEQLVPRALLDSFSGRAQIGNPDLDSTDSFNVDMSFEYFTEQLGVLGVAVFYKDISNYIFRTESVQADIRGVPGPWFVTTFENARDAKILGVELRAVKQLDFLPSPFNGLGIEFSYVYADTELTTISGRTATIPFSSDQSSNLSLVYDSRRFDARLAYSYQSAFLRDSINDGSPFNEQFIDARSQLDLTLQYHVAERVSIFVKAFNLTDEPFERSTRVGLLLRNEFQGRQFGAGFRVRL